MISYPAFFTELEKIAEAGQKPPATKDKVRRGLAVGGAAALGGGLAHGTARLIASQAKKRGWVKQLPKSALRKYGPAALGALAAGGGMLLATARKKSERYIDEGERPKQHGPHRS